MQTDLMTTPEHTLVGIHVAIALGFHRRWGWKTVALAGLASNIPDWDGVPMLFDMQRFEDGHRVWGHNALAIVLTSLVVGWVQSRYSWIEKIEHWIRFKVSAFEVRERGLDVTERQVGITTVFGIAILAQMLHLPCDMVVSGADGLSDWPVRPFWPISNIGFVYPMIPWGDVGPTLILMAGVIMAAKCPFRLSTISSITLLVLWTYLIARAWARGLLVV